MFTISPRSSVCHWAQSLLGDCKLAVHPVRLEPFPSAFMSPLQNNQMNRLALSACVVGSSYLKKLSFWQRVRIEVSPFLVSLIWSSLSVFRLQGLACQTSPPTDQHTCVQLHLVSMVHKPWLFTPVSFDHPLATSALCSWYLYLSINCSADELLPRSLFDVGLLRLGSDVHECCWTWQWALLTLTGVNT